MRRTLLILLVLLGVLGVAPAAWATFPGRDGELAVFAVTVPGTELVQPDTGHATALCPSPGVSDLCFQTSMPTWSPDGRLLAFGTSDEVQLINPRRGCVACDVPSTEYGRVVAFPEVAGTLDVADQRTLRSLPDDGVTGTRVRRWAFRV